MTKRKLGLDVKRMQLVPNTEIETIRSPYSQGPVQIIEGLYLGCNNSATDLKSLQTLGIAAVLNVAKECPLDATTQLKVKFDWTHDEDLSHSIDQAIEIIDRCRLQGLPILVHCLQGLSRSAALIIGYIMKSHRMSCSDAYVFVKQRAPQISPNVSLIAHLYHLEKLWSF